MLRRVLYGVALALGVLGTQMWTSSAFAERRVALIVGNSAYQNAPALPNPSRDARAIAATFQKNGYDVVSTAYDLGNLDFKRAIRQFEDAAADADIAVVYYAGHGIEIHGTNYVIPVDAKLASDRDADDEAIPLDRLVDSVAQARKLRVIILDACRDNPFSRNMKQQRVAMRGVTAAGLSAVEPSGINTLIAYAAKAGSQAEDGNGDHSPFAQALMDNLFVPGLDVRLAFGRVRDEVLAKTGNRQEPFVYGSLGGGTVAIVSAPDKPSATANADTDGDRKDFELVSKIGTRGAFEVYLTQHPTGFYSKLAREEINKIDTADATGSVTNNGTPRPTLVAATSGGSVPPPAPSSPAKDMVVASIEPPKPPTPSGPSSEEQRAWDRIKDSSSEADYRTFIRQYPHSVLADVAQQHLDAIVRAAQEKAKAAAEAAAKAEAERQAQLAEAKRQADEAARLKAQQEAQLAAAQAAAKAAAQAQAAAEREAALKREEEAHQAAIAALQAAAAKQQASAEAAKKQSEQQASLQAAQQAAAAAEQARLNAERAAQAQADASCKNEQDRLTTLQGQGAKGRDDLKSLQSSLTCERLRPQVTAALDKANALPDVNTPAQIKSAQLELSRLGCFTGTADGKLSPTTTVAIQHYQAAAGKPVAAVDISDTFIADLKGNAARVCPLVCPTGKVANGDTCIASAPPAEKPAPVAHHDERPAKKTASRPEPQHHEAERERPAPHAVEQASSAPPRASSGGGGHGTMIGVGF